MKNVFLILFINILIINSTYSQTYELQNNSHLFPSKRILNIIEDTQKYPEVLTILENILSEKDPIKKSGEQYDRGALRIIGEVVVGSGIGIAVSFVPLGAISFGGKGDITIEKNSNLTYVAIYSLYVLGSSFGVYTIAKGGNKELSFLATLGFASLGGILASIPKITDGQSLIASLVGLPLIGALVYTNIIAPYPAVNDQTTNNYANSNSLITHKDLYNKSLLMNLNILRIEF